MNSMNRYLNCLAACLLALAALSSCNDDNEPTSVVEPDPSGYCLMSTCRAALPNTTSS